MENVWYTAFIQQPVPCPPKGAAYLMSSSLECVNFLFWLTGMWHEAANLILMWHLSWRGCICGRREWYSSNVKPGSGLCIHYVGLALPHLLSVKIPGRSGMRCESVEDSAETGMRSWFSMQPPQGCECLLPQQWASHQSEKTWEIMKAKSYRLWGCFWMSLQRGRWNFPYLPITVGWEGRLFSWWI